MAKNKITYSEISKAKVSDSRNIVISSCSKGGFTIAQQLEAKEGEKTTTVFLKNAFHIESLDGLFELRDAINLAIEISTNNEEDESGWDD